jgi:biotin synthase
VLDFGIPAGELETIVGQGLAFRTSGCPGKVRADLSACDRPYGDSPPSNIASYPFQPGPAHLRRIRHQLGMEKPGEAYVEGEEIEATQETVT